MKIDVRVFNNIPDRDWVERHKNDEDLFMKYNANISIMIIAQKKIDDNLSTDEIRQEILKYLENLDSRCVLDGCQCIVSLINETKTKVQLKDGIKVFDSLWTINANDIVATVKNNPYSEYDYLYTDICKMITNNNIEYVINNRKGA